MTHYSGSTGCCEGYQLKSLVKEIQAYGVGGYKLVDNIDKTYKKVEGKAVGDDYMYKWHDGTWRVGVHIDSDNTGGWDTNKVWVKSVGSAPCPENIQQWEYFKSGQEAFLPGNGDIRVQCDPFI